MGGKLTLAGKLAQEGLDTALNTTANEQRDCSRLRCLFAVVLFERDYPSSSRPIHVLLYACLFFGKRKRKRKNTNEILFIGFGWGGRTPPEPSRTSLAGGCCPDKEFDLSNLYLLGNIPNVRPVKFTG